ncbi:hypothetical protein PAL_GLEAN10001197 [Pteropus alecto]|uniref:Uncharacterized protein n=1 Tax=Pteropus alecto TaxID=9402 RepID=L5L3Z8_PTEAL|nr:hypothetical protein PAL_GLEAN10001197 [Pteropus alecto]
MPCLPEATESLKLHKKPLPPQEASSLSLGPAVKAPGPMHPVMLGPASGDLEATAAKFLFPLIISQAPAGPRPGVPAKHPQAGLGSALGVLQSSSRRRGCSSARNGSGCSFGL